MEKPPTQPFFYHQNRRFESAIGKKGEYSHFFGHSHNLAIQNGPRIGALHQLVNLNLLDPVLALSMPELTRLPLLYCFRFEGGHLEYDVLSDNEIRITKLDDDTFSDDWPYRDYPERFPKLPLALGAPRECTVEEFKEDVWQGIRETETDRFICIVPPDKAYGVHLWEEDRDTDSVHVKFFVDQKSRHVVVYNECD